MINIKKILISSDPLFTKETEQLSNRRWMKDLLSRPIERATNIKPESLFSSLNREVNAIDRKKFFQLSDIDVDLDITQFWYDQNQISQESLNYLNQFIDETTLIIGYELSYQTRSLFSKLNVPFVDMWLHPVRFLDDVLFGMNSNINSINESIFKYNIEEDLMYLYADKIKIQTYKGWRRIEAAVKPNSALFVGQMLNDKSICSEGKMLSLLDFKEKFDELGRDYNKVYYSRHPYIKNGDEEIMSYINSCDFAEVTDIPTYRLLSSNRIKKVASLSSSILSEAKYFNKEVDYFFKPVMNIGDITQPNAFASIYQTYISPHFWSDILSHITPTNPCKEVLFIDGKDKIRDMLGFYWGYPDIDKNEYTRRELLNRNKQTVKTAPAKTLNSEANFIKTREPKKFSGFYQSGSDWENLKLKIDQSEIVSFDIFDTLIERVIDEPNDIFDFMTPRISKSYPQISNFKKIRQDSRHLAILSGRANGEEVLLKDRYLAIGENFGLDKSQVINIHNFELELEKQFCVAKFWGIKALNYAKSKGKKIILVSDIFFDRDFIIELLDSCEITGYDKIYLSSEEGKLKQTGNLFPVILRELQCNPNTILHIGDNKKADIEKAEEHGLNTYFASSKSELTKKVSHYDRIYSGITDNLTRSMIKGLVSRNYTNTFIMDEPGFIQSSPSMFGYNILGPMFYGFSKWIYDNTKNSSIKDIYFLARDGEIAKKVYDILSAGDENAPKSHYILASRRSVKVASIRNKDDILDVLETNFTPTSISNLLKNRFGINSEDIDNKIFQEYGFESHDTKADWKKNKERIKSFFLDSRVSDLIIKNSSVERKYLLELYKKNNLDNTRNPEEICFVDIGHAGSIQKSICDLLNLNNTLGLYFATEEKALKTLKDHRFSAYVANLMPTNTANEYKKHILMYELVFLNQSGSFVKMDGDKPIFLNLNGEDERVDLISKVHESVTLFANDLVNYFIEFKDIFILNGTEAISAYNEFLNYPEKNDVQIFKNVNFENSFSGRDTRWVISPDSKSMGIWKEGYLVLQKDKFSQKDNSEFLNLKGKRRIIYSIIKLLQNETKANKFARNPRKYFLDSKKVQKIFGEM